MMRRILTLMLTMQLAATAGCASASSDSLEAAAFGHTSTVGSLLERFPPLVSDVDRQGRSALSIAAANGNEALVEQLAAVGATIDLADHFSHRAESELRHVLAELLCDPEQVAHHALRCAGEALAKFGVLGRDADGAGVEVALPNVHTSERD